MGKAEFDAIAAVGNAHNGAARVFAYQFVVHMLDAADTPLAANVELSQAEVCIDIDSSRDYFDELCDSAQLKAERANPGFATTGVRCLNDGPAVSQVPAKAAFDGANRMSTPIAPANVRFAVSIKFTDGEYTNKVTAANEERALGLAMSDARMGSPFGSFFGKVVSHDVVAA